jgi:general secretion pathway protein N
LQLVAGKDKDMFKWPKIFGLALLSSGTLMTGPTPKLLAATSATLDILSDDAAGPAADRVDIGRLKPISAPNRETAKPAPAGNPLWAVPLSVLTATQQRPIFSASRRPPQPAVVAPAAERVNEPAPPKSAEQERPPLALIGAVVGDGDAIAVFVDRTSQKVVRLRRGETLAGWVLGSVLPREVTLRKAGRTEVLVLQRPDSPAGVPGTPDAAGLMAPAAGGANASYAPFVPRSTPKHGEPDGL